MLSPLNQLASGAEKPCSFHHLARDMALHRLAQQELAVVGHLSICRLLAWLVLQLTTSSSFPSKPWGSFMAIDQIVIANGTRGFQRWAMDN
jgi:hypothetical protein